MLCVPSKVRPGKRVRVRKGRLYTRALCTLPALYAILLLYTSLFRVRHTPYAQRSGDFSEQTLVIFTTIRGDELRVSHPQHVRVLNSLKSFEALRSTWHVVIFADDTSLCKGSHLSHLRLVRTSCLQSKVHKYFQRPTLDFILRSMSEHVASKHVAMYVNSDIILLAKHFDATYDLVRKNSKNFVITGRRYDLDVKQPVDFSSEQSLRTFSRMVLKLGKQHTQYGLDFFIFSHEALTRIIKQGFPAFLVGIYRWDNVMLSTVLLTRHLHVFDGSETILAVHQGTETHDHKHEKGSKYNDELARRFTGKSFILGNTENIRARIVKTADGIAIKEDTER